MIDPRPLIGLHLKHALVKEYKYIMISYNVPMSLKINGGIPSLELCARTTIAESPRAK